MPPFRHAARGIGRLVSVLSLACHLACARRRRFEALPVKQVRAHLLEALQERPFVD